LARRALRAAPDRAARAYWYVNLGIIAALRGDASASAECLERGFRLGYRNRGIQKQVQQILARVNVDLGDVLAD